MLFSSTAIELPPLDREFSPTRVTNTLSALLMQRGTEAVLATPADRSYITVEPGQTAESYTAGLRQKCITALVLTGAYVILYGLAWCVIWASKRKIQRAGL